MTTAERQSISESRNIIALKYNSNISGTHTTEKRTLVADISNMTILKSELENVLVKNQNETIIIGIYYNWVIAS